MFRNHLPSSSWIEACYSGHPNLLMGKYSLHSCCGVQQGDPLGPLGFALTLHPIIEAEVPNLDLNAWYLDDGTLIGSPEDLLAGVYLEIHRPFLLALRLLCQLLPSQLPVQTGRI